MNAASWAEPRLDSLLAGWDSPVSFELEPLPPFELAPLALDTDAPANNTAKQAAAVKKTLNIGQAPSR